jgi:putative ABC transport system permease protein
MMLRHLLTLTWKRKSRNLMVSLEILLAFAIVFAIAAVALHYGGIARAPLGFDSRDTWSATMLTGDRPDQVIPAGVYDTLRRNLLDLPEVREVGFMSAPPYQMWTMSTTFQASPASAQIETESTEASDGVAGALGIKLLAGRWFSQADDGQADLPVVINRRMATTLFGGAPAVGQRFISTEYHVIRTFRVVGLIEDFRNKGPLMTPGRFVITRFTPHAGTSRVRTILLRLAPGTPRAFEAKLIQRLQAMHHGWSYQIEPLEAIRASTLKMQVTPFVILAVVAVFMLAMVAFGLFGVLWQNTARRIPEIGLRRAVGASRADIYRQIVGEQLLLSTLAMLAALALLVQLPLTGAFGAALGWALFAGAAGVSMGVIYLLSLLCSLYPGWHASRLDPTSALHYE